jgi:CheY-like chemotaxis protein
MPHVKTILMIDDDREDFELLNEVIVEMGADITTHFVERCTEVQKYKDISFDMVLLDINMPLHDGFSWLKGIRESGYKKPVVMYTNSSAPGNIERAYQEGADLYFAKPESFTNMLNGFKKLFHLDWSDRASIRQLQKQNDTYIPFRY